MGGEGFGGTTVEHRIPQSEDESLATEYSNCLLACRLCNRSRGRKPVVQGDRRLLDPTRDRWATHFTIVTDRIEPAEDDHDAVYTLEAYDLNDERKVRRRLARRRLLEDRLELLSLMEELQELLVLSAQGKERDRVEFAKSVREIGGFRLKLLKATQKALSELARYAIVPKDAPVDCRCATTANHVLPDEIERQALEIHDEARGSL